MVSVVVIGTSVGDLAGHKMRTLELRATDGGDGASNDHADWAEATFLMQDGAPAPAVLPAYESIRVATRSPGRRYVPRRPPVLYVSRTSSMTMDLSTDLHIS